MDRLKELLKQRKEINEQIRQIMNDGIEICERVKIDKEHYATNKPDEWMLSVKRRCIDTGSKEKWISIVRGTDREEVIGEIETLINNLVELKKKEGKNED